MYAPSLELAQEYAKILQMPGHSSSGYISKLSAEYVLKNFPPNPATGKKNRVMVLLFQGEDAVCKIRQVAGELSTDRYGGETISGTYGDLVSDVTTPEKPVYFEPGVLVLRLKKARTRQFGYCQVLCRQRGSHQCGKVSGWS